MGTKNFSLSHARDKTKKTSFLILHRAQKLTIPTFQSKHVRPVLWKNLAPPLPTHTHTPPCTVPPHLVLGRSSREKNTPSHNGNVTL